LTCIGSTARLEVDLDRRRIGYSKGPRGSGGEPYKKFRADLESDDLVQRALKTLARRNVPLEQLTHGLFLAFTYLRDEAKTNTALQDSPSKRHVYRLAQQLESDAIKVAALNTSVATSVRSITGLALWSDEGIEVPDSLIKWIGEKQELEIIKKLPASMAEVLRAEAKWCRSLYHSFKRIRSLRPSRWVEIGLLKFVIATSRRPHYREVTTLLEWLFQRAEVGNVEMGEEALRRRYERNPTDHL
jgi:hypothetical protein